MPGQTTQPSAPSKVVRFSDLETLVGAYSSIDNTGAFGKWIADAEMTAIGKKNPGQGVYSDGKFPTADHLFVDSQFLRNGMNAVMNDPKTTPALKAYLTKVNQSINDAINGCPDHSAEVTQGKLKPIVKAAAPAPK